MKKRFITMFVFLLIACLMLTGCSVGENTGTVDPTNTPETEVVVTEEPVETEEPANTEDEMYEYEVGGTTLKLRTRIEDYITDEGYFRYMDLATELGWYSVDTDIPTKSMVFDDEIFINLRPTYPRVDYVSFGVLKSIEPWKEKFNCQHNEIAFILYSQSASFLPTAHTRKELPQQSGCDLRGSGNYYCNVPGTKVQNAPMCPVHQTSPRRGL